MLYADANLTPVFPGSAYVSPDGTTYPPDFPKAEIPGLTLVTETTPPNDPAVMVLGFHVSADFVQVWDTRQATHAERVSRVNTPIIARIAELDRFIPRGLEDLIAALAVDISTLPQIQQERLAEKVALRSQLLK